MKGRQCGGRAPAFPSHEQLHPLCGSQPKQTERPPRAQEETAGFDLAVQKGSTDDEH